MAVKALNLRVAVLFLVALPAIALARPSSGLFSNIVLTLNGSDPEGWTSHICKSVGLYGDSKVFTVGTIRATADKVPVEITLSLIRPQCANVQVDDKSTCKSLEDPLVAYMYNIYTTDATKDSKPIEFHHKDTVVVEPSTEESQPTAANEDSNSDGNTEEPPTKDTSDDGDTEEPPTKDTSDDGNTEEPPTKDTSDDGNTEEPPTKDTSDDGNTEEPPTKDTSDDGNTDENIDSTGGPTVAISKRSANSQGKPIPPEPVFNVTSSNMYILQISARMTGKQDSDVTITLKVKAKNPHGYLSAVDFPAFVFYGLMTGWYAILSIIWFILMCCSYQDLVRLQFWIGAVLILGFLEKTFFVSEYSSINQGANPAGLILIAETVSAAKRALSRMLLIIVALGFGTVKPRLGDSLGKVLAAGAIYFIVAGVDGIVRIKQETHYTRDTSATVTEALSIVLEIIIFYWIFASLVATRRALRLRKNYVKLSLYNHFAYTLIFAIIVSLAFIIWVFAELNFPRNDCLVDWREVWLRDCFWHMLFCFILIIVMVLWRPSSNRVRFAYSLVHDQDEDEEEVEQGPNKNFETLKMRQVSKPDAPAPPSASSQVEDDLRWVEENLPTSAVDKALPLILDSDEEVMTTKFEMSKLN